MRQVKKKDAHNQAGPRKFNLSFSLTGLVSLAFVVVIGLSWVFILGILVGRGYKPEQAVPELARIMPTPTPAQDKAEAQPASDKVLKAEELSYLENLQGKSTPPHPKEQPERIVQPRDPKQPHPAVKPVPASVMEDSELKGKKQPGKETKVVDRNLRAEGDAPARDFTPTDKDRRLSGRDVRPAGDLLPAEKKSEEKKPEKKDDKFLTGKTDKERKDAKTETKPDVKTDSKPDAKPDAKKDKERKDAKSREGVFDYAYQVAAYNVLGPAKEFQARLKSLGINSTVEESYENGAHWYRVNALFRGKPEDTRELKARLQTVGVKKALLRSKKPI